VIISIIVVRIPGPTNVEYWTTEAWDEFTLDENPQGFEEALDKARQKHGDQHVGVLKVELPRGALAKPFEIPKVEGKVVP
jgi:hypothetical protein